MLTQDDDSHSDIAYFTADEYDAIMALRRRYLLERAQTADPPDDDTGRLVLLCFAVGVLCGAAGVVILLQLVTLFFR